MSADFYMVLGVPADATDDQIKAAYRQKVKELHPDHYGPDAQPFLQLQEAYSILGDRRRREQFDERRAAASSGLVRGRRTRAAEPMRDPRGIRPVVQPRSFGLAAGMADFRPSYEELFDRLWSNFTLLTRPKAEHLESLTIEIVLSPEEAMRGGRVRILLPSRVRCPACAGHGAVGLYECWECEGAGAVTREVPVEVSYPAGITREYVGRVPLSRWGIGNFYLSTWFRVGAAQE